MWHRIAWIVGNIIYYVFGKTCGELNNSHYTNKPCILAPGHSHACVTDWEWNNLLNCHIRFWFAQDIDGSYHSRTELNN